MDNIIDFLMVDRFNFLALIIVCLVSAGITFYACVCGIRDEKRKEEQRKKIILNEMHNIALNSTPMPDDNADKEEMQNALSYLESLNVGTSLDRKA